MDENQELSLLTARGIIAQRASLTQNAVARQYARRSHDWSPYGSPGYQKSLRDSDYHFTYLSEAVMSRDQSLFLNYVAWLKVLFNSLHFPATALGETLIHTKAALQELLAPDQAAVAIRFVDAALDQYPSMPESVPSFLQPANPHYDLAAGYLRTLLNGDRRAASQMILAAVKEGVEIKDIYLDVFQTTQREVGRLWHLAQVSVAQEHFCTAATQMIISQLYPYIFSGEKNGRTLVAACVGEELHEMGMRMVADFFEMDGWDTCFLGANTPTEAILSAISERKADVAALSIALPVHVSRVTETIQRIRSRARRESLKILVGGYPFNLSHGLWKAVGADGWAPDALGAVQLANRLVEMKA